MLDHKQRIRLQDLTCADIKAFINDRLKDSVKFPPNEDAAASMETLVEAIAERADGIFFWVALVVQSLRAPECDSDLASLL